MIKQNQTSQERRDDDENNGVLRRTHTRRRESVCEKSDGDEEKNTAEVDTWTRGHEDTRIWKKNLIKSTKKLLKCYVLQITDYRPFNFLYAFD